MFLEERYVSVKESKWSEQSEKTCTGGQSFLIMGLPFQRAE